MSHATVRNPRGPAARPARGGQESRFRLLYFADPDQTGKKGIYSATKPGHSGERVDKLRSALEGQGTRSKERLPDALLITARTRNQWKASAKTYRTRGCTDVGTANTRHTSMIYVWSGKYRIYTGWLGTQILMHQKICVLRSRLLTV